MSVLGRQAVLSPLVGVDGTLASQGANWHRYTLRHSALTVAICSDQPLSALYKIEPTELTRVDWLAAVSSMDTVTASMIERVNDRCSIEL
jgi:hypothetical protein